MRPRTQSCVVQTRHLFCLKSTTTNHNKILLPLLPVTSLRLLFPTHTHTKSCYQLERQKTMSSLEGDPASSRNIQVDGAFERCFGYRWSERDPNATTDKTGKGNEDTNPKKVVLHEQLADVFGSRKVATRILRLYDISTSNNNKGSSKRPAENSISVLNRMTKRIKNLDSTNSSSSLSLSASTMKGSSNPSIPVATFKKSTVSAEDYMNLPLPASVVQTKQQDRRQSMELEEVKASSAAAASARPEKKKSNLDSVLKQLAGPKKVNTVEKTSGDWENFKGTDKQLQDELERTAQGKDAFLVKQDFLERVDQRRFELEKDERDQERARRQLASASSQK